VTREQTHIRFVVEDNGNGLSPKREGIRPNSAIPAMKGYALDNIRQRLLLEYGQEAVLSMTSETGIGMTVSIVVPVQADEIEHSV